jgi:hypothetical protein
MLSRICAAALIFLLGQLGAREAAAQTDPDCRLTQYASLDLTLDGGGVLVPVSLNGRTGSMRLHPAWPVSFFYGEAVRDLGLPRRNDVRDLEVDLGAQRITETAKFESLILGQANLTNGEWMVLPSSYSDTAFGVLGMDVFDRIDFELDLRGKKLNLFSQDHCAGQVVYWSDSFASTRLRRESGAFGNLYFEIQLDGKKLDATWSPSAPMTTLPAQITKRLFGFDETAPDVEVEGDGIFRRYIATMQLTAPGLTGTNTRVALVPAAQCSDRLPTTGTRIVEECRRPQPLMLGRNILEQLRLYFATKEKVLYYTAAEAAPSGG